MRKREHENKTGGNWGQEWRQSFSLPFFFPPPSPFPRSHSHAFARLSLTRHHYNLRAWKKLGPGKKIRAVFIKLLNHKKIFYTYSRTQSFIVFHWDTLAPQLSCPSYPFIVPRHPRFQVTLFSGFTPSAGWCKRWVGFNYKENDNKQDDKWVDAKKQLQTHLLACYGVFLFCRPTGWLKYKMFDMSNFPEEVSGQQLLKRWVVAPFGQAREDKSLPWNKSIHVGWVDWVHLSVHVSEGLSSAWGLCYSDTWYFDDMLRVKSIPFFLNFWCLVLIHELLYDFSYINECWQLTLYVKLHAHLREGREELPGAGKGGNGKSSWTTVVHQTGTISDITNFYITKSSLELRMIFVTSESSSKIYENEPQ